MSSKKTTKTKNSNKQKVVLLDSHAILHRAYHALPDFSSSKGEPTGAIYGLSMMIISIIMCMTLYILFMIQRRWILGIMYLN